MNKQELLEEIRRLNEVEAIPQEAIAAPAFTSHPNYQYLRDAFDLNYDRSKWKWHQLVRFALTPPEDFRYMFEQLRNLLIKYRMSSDDYFELKIERGSYLLPNPLSQLNNLQELYSEYFYIYTDIVNQIHFEYTKTEYEGADLRGKINWNKTLGRSVAEFPTSFISTIKYKEFITPENILLVLCAHWLYRESNRLLRIEFDEPLDNITKQVLLDISGKTLKILQHFPFQNLLNASMIYKDLDMNDEKIIKLETEGRQKMQKGILNNPRYEKLFAWVRKFKELNLRMISKDTLTTYPLDSIENLDTIYEAWIFFELLDYFSKKGLQLSLHMRKKPYFFEMMYGETLIKCWYEKEFKTDGTSPAWAVSAKPDFTVMVGDEIIAIFDAKNYGVGESKADPTNKMLGYMTNLDCNFGALFFPHFPKQKATQEFVNSTGQKPRYHSQLKLSHLRMDFSGLKHALQFKDQTLSYVFDEVIRRIPMKQKAV